MRLAVLSGKGGAGKTFFATSLAYVANEQSDATYVDCDVEAPNGHLFVQPKTYETSRVTVPVPRIDEEKCTSCRTCTNFCAFNALVMIKDKVKVYDELCHHCNGCAIVCEHGAVSYAPHVVGEKSIGSEGLVPLITGLMNIGEPSGNPIISAMLTMEIDGDVIIDCPPGSACNVMESIDEADYCLIVAEPTIFGLHNMEMVVELCQTLKKPFGVVFNKANDDLTQAMNRLKNRNIPCFGGMSDEIEVAIMLSEGEMPVVHIEHVHDFFAQLLNDLRKESAR